MKHETDASRPSMKQSMKQSMNTTKISVEAKCSIISTLRGGPKRKSCCWCKAATAATCYGALNWVSIVSLQWLIARVEMHHKKTHNETHNEIPSQFLQALQYLWVWGKWDLLVRWLRRYRCGEIMAASWLFGDFTDFTLILTGSVLSCETVHCCASRRWGSYASERLVCMPGAEPSILLWSPATMQLKSDCLSVCNDL
jgi:hypothetical protein